MNIRLWGILVVLLAVLGGLSFVLSRQQTGPVTEKLPAPSPPPQPQAAKLRNATQEPGRVIVLDTTRGKIEFVMFEKDCPKTTARIAGLVQDGSYSAVPFPRVEDWVIQTEPAKRAVKPMGLELAEGLHHKRGTVGIARTSDPNSNTSVIYITLKPAPQLDLQYINFGHVIRGMDVADKIKLGDKIRTATIHPLSAADKQAFDKVMAEGK